MLELGDLLHALRGRGGRSRLKILVEKCRHQGRSPVTADRRDHVSVCLRGIKLLQGESVGLIGCKRRDLSRKYGVVERDVDGVAAAKLIPAIDGSSLNVIVAVQGLAPAQEAM